MEKHVRGCKLTAFTFTVCVFYVYSIFWLPKTISTMGDSDVELRNHGWLVT